MPSIAVTGKAYLRNASNIEAKGPFTRRFLAEGDSWMDRSSATVPALPWFLAEEMNRQGQTNLIIDISTAGDSLRRISDMMQGEFAWWLNQFAYDGVLFSAGGNDFIEAALDPPPGQGLLRNMAGLPLPAKGYDCVNPLARDELIERYLKPNFGAIYQAVRAHPLNAETEIFLNSYDTPTARNAPAGFGVGPWLYPAYRANAIDPSLWVGLTEGLFDDIESTVQAWCRGRRKIKAVPTAGVLMPAQNVPGSSGDWLNEIHPGRGGWRKLARVWMQQITTTLPRG